MEIPKYNEFFHSFLLAIKDGQKYTIAEIRNFIIKYFKFGENELEQKTKSGVVVIFDRIGWAKTYLKKSLLIEGSAKSGFSITGRGIDALNSKKTIDEEYLKQFSEFVEFKYGTKRNKGDINIQNEEVLNPKNETPTDAFEEAFEQLNNELKDEILERVLELDPIEFERFVLDLLKKMGYGTFENATKTTSATNDGGIDGIIMQDKLGFDLIYVQAKLWDINSKVSRPEIQKFVGAIADCGGGKGLFITTAKFTKEAIESANKQHIKLIDGDKLAEFMIEYNFGVGVKQIFEIKVIDNDLFDEYGLTLKA